MTARVLAGWTILITKEVTSLEPERAGFSSLSARFVIYFLSFLFFFSWPSKVCYGVERMGFRVFLYLWLPIIRCWLQARCPAKISGAKLAVCNN